jgi:hypothetical protein
LKDTLQIRPIGLGALYIREAGAVNEAFDRTADAGDQGAPARRPHGERAMDNPAAAQLRPVDALEVLVLVDNVTDSLSTVPSDVDNENVTLVKAGMKGLPGQLNRDARTVFEGVSLHAVTGGFHLGRTHASRVS